jgi:phosphohistidine phosphatase
MRLYLVHHGDAVSPDTDPQRPLSTVGHLATTRLAADAAARGVKPAVIWHSGKLRARQTAELFWKVCNPFAEFSATSGLQPNDFPGIFRDHLIGESRDVMAVGHMPSLPRVLAFLLTGRDDGSATFPLHGLVVLERADTESEWIEPWRLDPSK